MTKSVRLLFRLITRARVTVVSLIKPVMMILAHQGEWMDQENSLVLMSKTGESLKLCSVSAALWGFSQEMPGASRAFPHWTQRGSKGANPWPPHKSHCDLQLGFEAKRMALGP